MFMLKSTHNAMIARIKKALGSENSVYNVLDLASNLRLDRDAAVRAKIGLSNELAAANKALKFADTEAVKLRKRIEELEAAKSRPVRATKTIGSGSVKSDGKGILVNANAKVPVKGKAR